MNYYNKAKDFGGSAELLVNICVTVCGNNVHVSVDHLLTGHLLLPLKLDLHKKELF